MAVYSYLLTYYNTAGFRGIALQSLGAPIEDTRPHKHASPSDTEPRATYHFFLVLITSLSKDWPERHERHRKWCTATEVRELTRWKEEVGKAFVNMPTDLDSLEKLVKSKTSSN